jgi:hypothetical protein
MSKYQGTADQRNTLFSIPEEHRKIGEQKSAMSLKPLTTQFAVWTTMPWCLPAQHKDAVQSKRDIIPAPGAPGKEHMDNGTARGLQREPM